MTDPVAAPDTSTAILEVAARAFRDRGYDVATLDEIAAELDISRPAVLHHFGSKQELLDAVVRPYIEAADELFEEWAAEAPLTARDQRRFLTALVDLVSDRRDVAALVSRDLTAVPHLPPDLQIADRTRRYAELVIDVREGDRLAGVRGLCALGVIARVLVAPDDLVDLDDPEVREAVVDAALAALRSGRRKS
jgi:AcrR family transcriptional regulator